MNYLDCWIAVAKTLFVQGLTGAAEFVESVSEQVKESDFGFAVVLRGDEQGRLSIALDAALLDASLLGEGVDQRSGWRELLGEVAEAAASELLARSGKKCQVESLEPLSGQSPVSCAFQLRTGDRAFSILVRNELQAGPTLSSPTEGQDGMQEARTPSSAAPADRTGLSPGLDLLLDVELEATLRFGCREIPLGELLELGPGDVVELDRHVSDPVDLIVGDKIVAQGVVVLVNGNFGLRVTEVAAPRKRLESIRCLF